MLPLAGGNVEMRPWYGHKFRKIHNSKLVCKAAGGQHMGEEEKGPTAFECLCNQYRCDLSLWTAIMMVSQYLNILNMMKEIGLIRVTLMNTSVNSLPR
jgi:hypothetical protein